MNSESGASGTQLTPAVDESARSIFIAWERLRIVFNGVLATAVILGGFSHLADASFWRYLASEALLANICFCAGPVAEGYLVFLNVPRPFARRLVFLLGTLVGLGLALSSVAYWMLAQILD